MNLALFDFDGTITNKDMFTAFIYYAAAKKRIFWGKICLLPVIIGYKAGIVPASKLREAAAGFAFKHRPVSELYASGRQYAGDIIPKYLKPEAMERIQWHKNQGDQVVVVSASLDVYLKFWCRSHGLDLICSEFDTPNGLIAGKYHCPDCSGEEKAMRIKRRYDLSGFKTIYAYGDTSEDRAMLSLADVKFYRWKQI